MAYNYEWGYKIYESQVGEMMITAGTLILPYSYLSILQHFQRSIDEIGNEAMHAADFYVIQGKNPFHKYMDNSEMLEKLFDNYFIQNPYLIICSLYKEKNVRVVQTLQESRKSNKVSISESRATFNT